MNFTPYKPQYFSLIHKWHIDDEINRKIGYDKKPTEQETKSLLDIWLNDEKRVLFLIEHHNQIIGYVTLGEINKQYETAILHTTIGEKKFLGQKVCVEVIDEILDYAFNTLELYRVTTYVMSNNPKLIETAKKYGWTQEGIMKDIIKLNGKRINYNIFRMLKTEFKKRGLICQ